MVSIVKLIKIKTKENSIMTRLTINLRRILSATIITKYQSLIEIKTNKSKHITS